MQLSFSKGAAISGLGIAEKLNVILCDALLACASAPFLSGFDLSIQYGRFCAPLIDDTECPLPFVYFPLVMEQYSVVRT